MLILKLLSLVVSQEASLEQEAEDACGSRNMNKFGLASDYQRALRRLGSQRWSISLVDYYSPGFNNRMAEAFGSGFVFLVLLVAMSCLALVFTGVYASNFCLFDHSRSPNKEKSRQFGWVALSFAAISFGLGIALLVVMVSLNRLTDDFNCSVISAKRDTLNGVNRPGTVFIGLSSAAEITSKFAKSLDEIGKLSAPVERLRSSKLRDEAQSFSRVFGDAVTEWKSAKVSDGLGVRRTPSLALEAANKSSDFAKEAEFFPQTAEELEMSAVWIGEFIEGGLNFRSKAILRDLAEEFSRFSLVFSQEYAKITHSVIHAIKLTQTVYGAGVSISLGAVTLLIGVSAILIFRLRRALEGYENFVFAMKVSLVLLGVCATLLSLESMMIFLVDANVVAGCTVFENVSQSQDVRSVTESLRMSLDEKITGLIQTCMTNNGAGSVSSLFEKEQGGSYEAMISALAGPATYASNRGRFHEFPDALPATRALQAELVNRRDGQSSEFDSVSVALSTLNSMLECNKTRFMLSQQTCPSEDPSCFGVFETNFFKTPSCATPAALRQFSNLKNYQIDIAAFADKVLGDLGEDTVDIRDRLLKIISMISFESEDIEEIINGFGEALSVIQNPASFDLYLGCKDIRNVFETIEDVMCYKFEPRLFFYFMINVFLALFLFFCGIFVWLSLFFRVDIKKSGSLNNSLDPEPAPNPEPPRISNDTELEIINSSAALA